MKTKNLTLVERERVVFHIGEYSEEEYDTFVLKTMDLFLEEQGYLLREREKIKGINVFRQWFFKQFHKRDKYIIETMLHYEEGSFENCFKEGYYNYVFYNAVQFRTYYQYLHQEFEHYDEMPMSFNYRHGWGLKTPQKVGFVLDFQCPFSCEKHHFFIHLS